MKQRQLRYKIDVTPDAISLSLDDAVLPMSRPGRVDREQLTPVYDQELGLQLLGVS